MGKLVMIDSQIFVWGIKGMSSPGQEERIPPARRFIEFLEEEKSKLLLPAPQMAELMSIVPPTDHPQFRRYFDRRFQVRPFDDLAAEKCAELLHNAYTQDELRTYRTANSVPKAKMKYDCMLVAMAITNRVTKIYSDDRDLRVFAGGQIEVARMPELAPTATQQRLQFEESVNSEGEVAAPEAESNEPRSRSARPMPVPALRPAANSAPPAA